MPPLDFEEQCEFAKEKGGVPFSVAARMCSVCPDSEAS